MWHHVSSLALLEGVTTEDSLAHLWRLLPRPHHEVNESVAVAAVQPEGDLLPGHRHLLHVLREFDLRLPIDLHQLVHAAQRWLPLAGDQVSPDTKTRDLVALLVEGQDRLLVNIIGRRDHHRLEPVQLVLLADPLHGLLDDSAKVRQVAGVNTDSNGSVAVVIEGQGHGAEVEKTAPTT